ncbi:MAG: class I adenylate-forming enzyme family protein [Hyphomonadaceae bacterium]
MYYRELDQAWAELIAPGAQYEMTDIEVRGVRMRAFKNAPKTVRDFWLATRAFGDRDYLIYQDERLTYAAAHEITRAVAAWLTAQGIAKGDRVGIAMRNYPEWMLTYWACLSIGVAVVGVNAWWVAEEIDYALRDSEPKIVFCDQERLDRMTGSDVRKVAVRCAAGASATPWSEVIAHRGALPDVDIDPDDDACIFYTSGTTGRSKGAQLTHRGCISNLFNLTFMSQVQTLATRRARGEPAPAALATPAALTTTPLFHVSANNCGAYLATAAGGKMVLMHHWDVKDAFNLIERERVTSLRGVPVMTREMLNHPELTEHDLSSVQSMGGGGAPLPPDLVPRIAESLPTTKPSTAYGMTETCGIISSVDGAFFIDKPTSVGRAAPSFDAACFDDAGKPVPQGQIGELWARGPAVIKGYINQAKATAETITDGWMHTGDIAYIDAEGFIHIVDRKKDIVLRGGENIYCAEVEACLYREPAIAECCVFGVPDERLGEEVGVAIVLRPGHALDAAALRAHCTHYIAKHKIPRFIWFRTEELPRNASGKFLRRQLREVLAMADAT